MYTKQHPRDKSNIIIPENYRGNAFNEIADDTSQLLISPQKDEETEQSENKRDVNAPLPILSSILPPKMSKHRSIFKNIGLEELLIVGTIIVLFQSNADEDIILLLLLLLFY